MRLPRFLLAGVLLYVSLFVLVALFTAPVGAIAAIVFWPLWYAVATVNAAVGVFAAGYKIGEEAAVMAAVFGIPAAVAGVGWLASARWWAGGPLILSGRTAFVLGAGVLLWAAIRVLSGLLTAKPSGTAALVFMPLWFLFCLANLLVGVIVAGYGVGEEIPILLLNFAVPAAVSVLALRF
ncbi:hypothetical protein KIPE111705_26175 [Kibdelosporangium persicum]|uniref:Uncharacterized protein n=1 Tax=Kibdelosporangium persicum TaxID=2698649 RepID=A0ABX2F3V3_9PSEU|nr:hypothetical protein [Kibdelosporangium persicum]NRN65505.1 hypothetical protein [Kibdelosporangium persicum]